MMNKIFGVKNITHLLYGFLICMPMLSILARTCYVAINKNAKDSYSDSYIRNLTKVVNTEQQIVGAQYLLQYDNTISSMGTSLPVYFTSTSIDFTQFNGVDYQVIGYRIYDSGDYIYLFDSSDEQHNINTSTSEIVSIMNNQTITYESGNGMSVGDYKWKFNYYLITMTKNSLDNVFEYSLSQFTKDNNLGNVDMFSWFTNLFLDQTNPTNQLYLGFVNWYLNYTLLVSSGYLLFLTLIWFVNYVRRILDKSMNQEYGGF